MAVAGIDVSKFQGNIDFNKVKADGYKFVIIRVNDWDNSKNGNVKDAFFETNYKKAKAAGLDVGVFFFSFANTIDYVATEAALCIDWLKGKQFEYPVYFDLERNEQFDQGMAFCDNAVKTFCTALEKAGYFAGVYCSTFWYTKCVSEAVRERFACWIADWSSKCRYTGTYGMWQNGTAYVNGIVGAVDHDICYVDYPTKIKEKGLNGFTKSTEPTTPDSTSTSAIDNAYDQFQAKYLGKAIDYDGTAGIQCVDLVDQYLKECFGITGVWVNGAKDFYNNFNNYPALTKAFDKVANTRNLVVKKGDIVIWGGGSWGHCGIGNGEGNIDWFISLEENTLGKHEPTQLIKHYFNGAGRNDCCNPVLGVLRPKSTAVKTQTVEKILDTGSCYKLGETTVGALAVKELLRLARVIKLHNVAVTDTKVYDQSAVDAVKALQKRWGYKQTGGAGENFVRKLYEALM